MVSTFIFHSFCTKALAMRTSCSMSVSYTHLYTFVLHDHIKLQLHTGVQNIFNSFQKDLDLSLIHISSSSGLMLTFSRPSAAARRMASRRWELHRYNDSEQSK